MARRRSAKKTIWSWLTKQDKADVAAFHRKSAQEIRRARERGSPWTEFRPFVNGWEKLGKAKCGSSGRHTKGCWAVVVSYCVGMRGCVVLCQKHYDRRLKEGY